MWGRQDFGAVALVLMLLGAGPAVWAQSAPLSRTADRAAPPGCQVAQFKGLAFGVHDPGERAAKALTWLQERAGACSLEQIEAIRANAASWLGTALTGEITVLLDDALERRASGDGKRVGQLYDHAGKTPPPASAETVRTGPPRAPVVQPMVNNGLLSGAVAPAAVAVPVPVPVPAPAAVPGQPAPAPGQPAPAPGQPAPVPGGTRTR